MEFEKELATALNAAEVAGRLILADYEKREAIADAPSSITTDTDRSAQELILQTIRGAFPSDALCAEEKTASLGDGPASGPRWWIVDPIDGTLGFARKNGEFCVMIAFISGGEMRVGVVLEPTDWKLTFAVQGQGCWRSVGAGAAPGRCTVRGTAALTEATITQSRSRTAKASPVVSKLRPANIVETFSAGVKLAKVASGEVDLYANIYPEFHDWDICAGHILVEEAGGRVTDLKGNPIRYGGAGFKQRSGLLASNGTLHSAAVEALQ